MATPPVREFHAQQPLPLEYVLRMANRVTVETLLLVVAYAAVLLKLVFAVPWDAREWDLRHWAVILLVGIWAVGMYHARLKVCVAEYYGQRPALSLYCFWPLMSMVAVAGLLLVAALCMVACVTAAVAAVAVLAVLMAGSEVGLVLAVIVGTLPGSLLGVILATSVVGRLAPQWLRLTSAPAWVV